ncbi:MAG: phosphoribosylglycinamide formyltransferase [Chloroflexota bacterium]
MQRRFKIGWFSSGRGEGSHALLRTVQDSIARGEINADISFVFSNRERGQAEGSDRFFDLVNTYGIPLITLSSHTFRSKYGEEWRPEFEAEAMGRLEGFDPDLCVLAGYMLIVGEKMCRRYPMLNLHPAAPGGPKGTWREVIWQLIEQRATETGVMMHHATPVLDEGPPVTYCTFSIRGKPFDRHWQAIEGRCVTEIRQQEGESNPLFQEIRQHGLAREFPLIITTIKAFSEGRLRIEGDRIVDADGKPIQAYDLTEEIDPQVKEALAE